MQKVLEILALEHREYRSKKTGNPGVLHLAQCVMREQTETGVKVLVGEALLPEILKDVKPGLYTAGFEMVVDFDKRISARLVALEPFQVQARPVPVAKAA